MSEFCRNRPMTIGCHPLLTQVMPHHGPRARNQAVSTAAARSRRRSRSGSAPSTAKQDHDHPVQVVDPRHR